MKDIKKLLFVTMAAASLCAASSSWAASITYTASMTGRDNTDPPPEPLITIAGTNYYALKSIDEGRGTNNAVLGFSSLAGLAPGSIIFTMGDLELLDLALEHLPTSVIEKYGEMDGSPRYLNLYKNGTLIATSADPTFNVTTITDPSSPRYGQATGSGQATLRPVGDDPFGVELSALTGGSNIIQIAVSNFIPTANTFGTNRNVLASAVFRADGSFIVNEFPPKILQQPTGQSTLVGGTATFRVVAPGAAPYLTYQWKCNGTNIPGATLDNLTLANLTTNQAGSYSVVVRNAAGATPSQEAVLTVLSQPEAAFLVDTNFNIGAGASSSVFALARQPDGKLLVGGDFTSFNDVPHYRLARLLGGGALDSAFSPVVYNYPVYSIAMHPTGMILIGGSFDMVNATSRQVIAGINLDGTLNTNFTPRIDFGNKLRCLAVTGDGKILLGGYFEKVNNADHVCLARLNADGTSDATFSPNVNGTVQALVVQLDGKILIGGVFSLVNGVTRNCLARLNADGTLDTGFNPAGGANSPIDSLALQMDGKILIGGMFDNYNGISRRAIARLNADASLDVTFNANVTGPVVSGTSPTVKSILPLPVGGQILIGGEFTNVNGVARSCIALLQPDGSLSTLFDPGSGVTGGYFHGIYTMLAQPDGLVVIGGQFQFFNGIPCNNLARINPFYLAPQAPIITVQPKSQMAAVAGQAIFNVEAIGVGPIRYQWSFNGTNQLANETNSTLILHQLAMAQAGGYAVMAQNPYGTVVSQTATLRVVRPPDHSILFTATIKAWDNTSPPVDPLLSIMGTQYYAFKNLDDGRAKADLIYGFQRLAGIAAEQLTFEIGDLELRDNTVLYGSNTVTESFVEQDHNPAYLRMFNNGNLIAASSDLALDIITVTDPASPQFGKATGRGYARMQAMGSDDLATELRGWCGGNAVFLITLDDFVPLSSSGTLARSTNNQAVFQATGMLTPYFLPVITQQPQGATTTNGGAIRFSSVATGTEPLFYQWRLNGANLANATNPILDLIASPPGIGNYTVVITNIAGAVTSQAASLSITGGSTAPLIISQPKSLIVTNANQVLLNVLASGSGTLKYQWKLNGQDITGETNTTLSLDPKALKSGNYTVVIRDDFGLVESLPAIVKIQIEPLLNLSMYAGIAVTGNVGSRYEIQYSQVLGQTTNWISLAVITLTNATQVFIDMDSSNYAKRFYKAVALGD